MHRIVLLRHGESVWHRPHRFTGWTDAGLSDIGVGQAISAAHALRSAGWHYDEVHCSVLTRAIKTAWLVQEELDAAWIPLHATWRLNARHLGALQGLTREEAADRLGTRTVARCLADYAQTPPELPADDPGSAVHDPRYAALPAGDIPRAESLQAMVARVVPYWNNVLAPAVQAGRRVLVVAHGGPLRALVKYLDNLDEQAMLRLDLPPGQPFGLTLDALLRPAGRLHRPGEA